MSVGSNIRAFRLKQGMTRAQFADIAGVKSIASISQWESDKQEPRYDTILKIAEYFDVSINEITGAYQGNKKNKKAKVVRDKIDELSSDDATIALEFIDYLVWRAKKSKKKKS